jgi:P27 family predicted phage terminase small subunit
MAGRKPLPTDLKILKGTHRKDRANKAEPRPARRIPSAPEHLSRYALMEWGRVAVELDRIGLLSEIDRSALAAYCQAYGRWREAEEKLNTSGLLIKTSAGNVVHNPLVGVANTALKMMHKYLTEFGMTPSSRSKVSAGPSEEPKKSKWQL